MGHHARVASGGVDAIIVLAATAVAVWVLGTFAFIYFWPRSRSAASGES
jgi:hypothetical protein